MCTDSNADHMTEDAVKVVNVDTGYKVISSALL